jgi:ribA/ribD-fused uncharacterized protein
VQKAIDSFSGHYRFLSNFYPAEVELDGIRYPTVEHAYQASKTDNPTEREIVRVARTAGQAKKLGRGVTLAIGWDGARIARMRQFLRQKFSDKVLRAELMETGNAHLVEGNYWGDTFWGVSKGRGENWLGRLLMEIRAEIQESAQKR